MTIGETLAAARRQAGLTVEDVSARTRIRATIIASLEADDFAACGGEFYTRANLRQVAAVVGLDPAEIVGRYDSEHGTPVAPTSVAFETDGIRERRRGFNWSAAMGLALVAAIVLLVGNVVLHSGRHGAGTLAGTIGSTSTPSASHRSGHSTPRTTAKPAPPSQIAKARGVEVVVTVARARGCWVRATNAAGRQLYEGTLTHGATQVFTDTGTSGRIKLVLGNAGAVDLTVNGHKLGAPGTLGQVTTVSFTSNDPTSG